jgi:hypothetical protein
MKSESPITEDSIQQPLSPKLCYASAAVTVTWMTADVPNVGIRQYTHHEFNNFIIKVFMLL